MILKIIGAVITIVSCGAAGYYLGNIESYRIADLLEMKRALSILKSEIEFTKNPLPRAFRNISLRTKKPISKIFARICEILKQNPEHGLSQIWEDCINECRREAYFDNDDITQLISFGKTLGYLDEEMQRASISLIFDYIDARVSELRAERDKNRKMYNSLGVLGGLLIVVLLA